MLRLLAIAFCLTAGMAAAQTPLWLASCSNQADASVLTCELAQSIVLTEDNQRVATAAFLKSAGSAEVTAIFTLPLGLFLPAGVAVAVDDASLGTLEFRSCDAQGCYATAPAPEDWQAAMQSGTKMTLTIERPDQQAVTFTFPLQGFSTSFDLLP